VQPATAIIATYQWDFGDKSAVHVTTGPQVIHSFTKRPAAENYIIKVTVTTTAPVQTADAITAIPGGL
jgi:hypothetical protein